MLVRRDAARCGPMRNPLKATDMVSDHSESQNSDGREAPIAISAGGYDGPHLGTASEAFGATIAEPCGRVAYAVAARRSAGALGGIERTAAGRGYAAKQSAARFPQP